MAAASAACCVMGAAASTLDAIGTEQRSKRYTKDRFLPELLEVIDFDTICDDAHKSASIDDIAKATNYVKQALTEAMGGNKVSVPQTQSYGCSVKY